MSKSITETINQLHSSLSEYIEATYHISDPSLVAQRQTLLNRLGVIRQQAYLESTPRYVAGEKFNTIPGLAPTVVKLFESISSDKDGASRLVYDPPYKHQWDSVHESLVSKKNLVIMTGTGSGKTESFLLPIIGKLALEAGANPDAFIRHRALRALVLYPMNALVNDQLGRLRKLFGDERFKNHFKESGGRIPTFARYTSRTPYPGVRDSKKDQSRFKEFEKFYIAIQEALHSDDKQERDKARKLFDQLNTKGKWPSKPDLLKWYGKRGSRWQDSAGNFIRANATKDDSELITRHEVQEAPPDLMITNYSMLEYMLMRPIERSIFEKTKMWLSENPEERFLIVLDEAHLYRGASGAEVGLLLRRLRERLGIAPDRFQVICATASFENKTYATEFAGQLGGVPAESFARITGEFLYSKQDAHGTTTDAVILSKVNLDDLYDASVDTQRSIIKPFLDYRNVSFEKDVEYSLFKALKEYPPLGKIINQTMGQAKPIGQLTEIIFPNIELEMAEAAVTTLLGLGSMAKASKGDAGLLPCRIHNFFRGLPGLWICINPECSELKQNMKNGIAGALYSQPRERCNCGARVFEFFTCRNCGSSHARAYTDDILEPSSLWSQPGQNIRLISSKISELVPLDILLEKPIKRDKVRSADLDIMTGRLDPENKEWTRVVYIKKDRNAASSNPDDDDDDEGATSSSGQFDKCCVCDRSGGNRPAVQDHVTKGDQPFLSLISRQIQIQPPNNEAKSFFSPLAGRKVLIFSDSRQIAAKLAPNLQMYSVRDSLRALLVWGYQKMQSNANIAEHLSLDDVYLAILLASNYFGVRLRPEVKSGENFYTIDEQIKSDIDKGYLTNDSHFFNRIFLKTRNERAPESLLKDIVNTVYDRFLGLNALALASLCVKEDQRDTIKALPSIPGVAITNESKIALANYWIKCWQPNGIWLKDMPQTWWKPNEKNVKAGVKGHKTGNFKAIQKIITGKPNQKLFLDRWLPVLKSTFTEDLGGTLRISGKNITLDFSEDWVRCKTCTSIYRPIPEIKTCLVCSSSGNQKLITDKDEVFIARKGYYRKGVFDIFASPPVLPIALIAAEHTAQLNASQSDDVFSKAEQNELLFQDIDIDWSGANRNSCAIDILSSTTTMEVGIDIGALSGAALRNMPPGRANYQQRAGRAGRRGNAVATVVAFGSFDSHDEHYFSKPEEMISGPVVDPVLTLDNLDIIKRHIRAFLLQKYHLEKIPTAVPSNQSNLFSVLGKVREFLLDGSVLNRNDFAKWLSANEENLKQILITWIPDQLSVDEKRQLADSMIGDCLEAVDDAIDYEISKKSISENAEGNTDGDEEDDGYEDRDEHTRFQRNLNDNLLDRLLYRGKLPRYAFPTDVATFHVFDVNKSTSYRPIMKFTPSQGLPIALSQYAPDKQVWISNKCYTSGAIYSPMKSERQEAWAKRRHYYQCENCGFATTEDYKQENKNAKKQCIACGEDLPTPSNWLRPPGFAHPIDLAEETSPENMPEVSYATRAKLYMPFSDAENWKKLNERFKGLKVRKNLLVSNTGPNNDGYIYCVACGKIEASANDTRTLLGQHNKPFPDDNPICQGGFKSTIVLGTDFITDIGLFSIDLGKIRLLPGFYSTDVALRTLCEALTKAGSILLEIEPGEIMAEYRPSLNAKGRTGEQVEIFLYDTLPGGAGFSSQLVDRGVDLFTKALEIMIDCPEHCDNSCYRCLRSFKNKFEHILLDRHIGSELTQFILTGVVPPFDSKRISYATEILFDDLLCNKTDAFELEIGVGKDKESSSGVISISTSDGRKYLVALTAPLNPATPVNVHAKNIYASIDKILVDELLIKNNLPSATKQVLERVLN